MPAQILDGEKIAMIVRNKVAVTVRDLAIKDVVPGLAVVLVGEDAASETYVRNKEKACNETGINSFPYRLPGDTTETQLLDLIGQLNADPVVHGILVQLPLPRHIDAGAIFSAIDPAKDVDGFHPLNVGKLCAQENTFVPCTPQGIMYLLAAYNVSPAGKHAVIVGRSGIVGKPVAQLLLASDATVTICHSKTTALGGFTRQADVLVVAAGRPRLVTASMVKPGAVVVDVGINRLDGDLVGDVDFESVKDVASYLTPVPGGVGPLTIAMLLKNTVQAATIK